MHRRVKADHRAVEAVTLSACLYQPPVQAAWPKTDDYGTPREQPHRQRYVDLGDKLLSLSRLLSGVSGLRSSLVGALRFAGNLENVSGIICRNTVSTGPSRHYLTLVIGHECINIRSSHVQAIRFFTSSSAFIIRV